MSVRPFRDIKRRKTKVINVGKVKIGGDNPISVQSMTNTLTTDVKATINQINDIAEEGADIVRVSCPDESSTRSLKEIWDAPAWKEITDAWITKKHKLHRCWRSCENGRWKSSNTVKINK